MATIEITRTHNLGLNKIKKLVTNIADEIKEEFNIIYHWIGNELIFEGSGTKGLIKLEENKVKVLVDLNWILRKTLKDTIEKKINGYLNKYIP